MTLRMCAVRRSAHNGSDDASKVQIMRVQEDHDGHTRNAVADCYTNGTFSKVLEFRRFHRRGRDSVSYRDAGTEAALMSARRLGPDGVQSALRLASEVQAQAWSALQELNGRPELTSHSINSDISQLPPWLPPPTSSGYALLTLCCARRVSARPAVHLTCLLRPACVLASRSRPAWVHRCSPRSLCCIPYRPVGLLQWWEAAGSNTCAFGGHRWWAVPEAATGPSIEAQAWRRLRIVGSVERDVYAQLLCGALLLPQGGSVAALLLQLRESYGASWEQLLNQEQGTPADEQGLYGAILRALRIAVFAFASHVQHAAAGAAASKQDETALQNLPDASIAAAAADAAQQKLCSRLSAELPAGKAASALLSGATMHAVTVLLAHELNMAAGMLIVWEESLQAQANSSSALRSHFRDLARSIERTCREVQEHCTSAAAALRVDSDGVQARIGLDEAGMQLLLQCADSDSVQARLLRLVDAQRLQLEWLAGDVCGRILAEVGVVLGLTEAASKA